MDKVKIYFGETSDKNRNELTSQNSVLQEDVKRQSYDLFTLLCRRRNNPILKLHKVHLSAL